MRKLNQSLSELSRSQSVSNGALTLDPHMLLATRLYYINLLKVERKINSGYFLL